MTHKVRNYSKKIYSNIARYASAAVLVTCLLILPVQKSYSFTYCYGDYTKCVQLAHELIQQTIEDQHKLTQQHFGTWNDIPSRAGRSSGTGELGDHQSWMIETIFFGEIMPALQGMTAQLSAVAMMHAATIGGFIDSKVTLDTQRTIQDLTAQAHRDYHPSAEMCVIGTNVRSLAETDMKKDTVRAIMNDRGLDRELANSNINATNTDTDREGRLEQFQDRYCDRFDNNPTDKVQTGFGLVCNTSATAETINKDINFTRTILHPTTLEIDFLSSPETDDEQDVLAMASNIYAHNLFNPLSLSKEGLNKEAGADEYNSLFAYMDLRSVVAKRSVARTSFNALTAMKAQGSQASAKVSPYAAVLLKELGYSEEEAKYMVTERPSYFAQLEILSKKLYQRPSFYTDLYDKPANVKRRGVAMQAIGLMVDRDIYDSRLRSEALLSVLLELKIMKAQDALQNNL